MRARIGVLIPFLALGLAGAQTFTIEQPKSNNAAKKSVVRPGEVVVEPEKPAKSAGRSAKAARTPKFEESTPAPPSEASVTTKRHTTRTAKRAKKPAPAPVQPTAGESEAELAKATPPPRPAPPPLEPVPSLTKMSNEELQQQILKAIRENVNAQSSQGVQVAVTDTEIELKGTIANGRDKTDAVRLAQSYSGNRVFKDQLQVMNSSRVVASEPVGANTGVPNTVGNNFSPR